MYRHLEARRYETAEDCPTCEQITAQHSAAGKVRKRPSRAAERRAAAQQIRADLDDLGDLYEDGGSW